MKNDRMFPAFYKVSFWDGERVKQTQGILFAATFMEATEKLTNYYGDADIDSLEILMTEENYLLEMNDRDLWYEMLHLAGGKDTFKE